MQGIDHAEYGDNPVCLAKCVNVKLSGIPQAGNFHVTEAHLLCLTKQGRILSLPHKTRFHLRNLFEALKEQLGNHCPLMQFLNSDTATQQFGHCIQRICTEFADIVKQRVGIITIKLFLLQMADAGFKAAHTLEDTFLQCAANAHYLARCLHLCSQQIAGRGELIKRETREFCNDIIKRGLHSRRTTGNRNVLKRHSEGDFCCHPGNGIAAGFACRCGGTADPWIDLNQVVFAAVGIKGKLNIAAAFDFQLPNDLDCAVIEHLKIMIVETQNRCNDHTVAGMDAYGIHIFHSTDGDGGVIAVPHDLEFDFLISAYALFDQHLVDRAQTERIDADLHQFSLVIGKSATGTAKGKCRTQDNRVTDFNRCPLCFLKIVGDFTGNNRFSDGLTHFLEKLPVLGAFNTLTGCAQQLYPAFLKHALLFKLDGQIEAGLPADSRNNGIRAFIAKDFSNVLKG